MWEYRCVSELTRLSVSIASFGIAREKCTAPTCSSYPRSLSTRYPSPPPPPPPLISGVHTGACWPLVGVDKTQHTMASS